MTVSFLQCILFQHIKLGRTPLLWEAGWDRCWGGDMEKGRSALLIYVCSIYLYLVRYACYAMPLLFIRYLEVKTPLHTHEFLYCTVIYTSFFAHCESMFKFQWATQQSQSKFHETKYTADTIYFARKNPRLLCQSMNGIKNVFFEQWIIMTKRKNI